MGQKRRWFIAKSLHKILDQLLQNYVYDIGTELKETLDAQSSLFQTHIQGSLNLNRKQNY